MGIREQRIPFLLWVCTAAFVHITWSQGADVVAKSFEDFSDLRRFARNVRGDLAPHPTVEIALVDQNGTPIEEIPIDQDPQAKDVPAPPTEKPKVPDPSKPPDPEAEPEKQPEQPKPELFPSTPAPTPPPQQAPPPADRRIAVRQHVQDPNQPDNPTAQFIGDEANHVKEQSVASITSNDTDDPKPSPGGQHTSPSKDPGNADQTRIGQSDDHAGDPTHAPGENAPDNASERQLPPEAKPPTENPPKAPAARPAAQPPPAQPAPLPQPTTAPTSPEVVSAERGSGYSLDPKRKAPTVASSAQPQQAPKNPFAVNPLGLGAGRNERGVQQNLTHADVVAAVGTDQLRRERQADGERRRSAHRGSWNGSGFERWRPAIENYVSSVRPGNQTALNTARVPFASYLNAIHNRIHPIFADGFLDSLDALPANHQMNRPEMYTSLEIVIDREQGRLVKMGVVKTSGNTAFDVGALDSVNRSQPFGKPPEAIVSADGNVYLHWEFHRNPMYACSTMHARPFMLNRPPTIETPGQPPSRTPQQPSDPREKGLPPAPSPPAREGQRYTIPPENSGKSSG